MKKTKECRKCRRTLEIENFLPDNLWQYGVKSTCTECFYWKSIEHTPKKKEAPKKAKKMSFAEKAKKWKVRKVNELTKMKVLTRDNWKCVYCWTIHWLEHTPHHTWFGGRKKYNEEYNTEKNLVTICTTCHHEIHHWITGEGKVIREFCENYLTNLYNNV